MRREERPTYRKWLRFYLDFLLEIPPPPEFEGKSPRFLSKLASKNQSAERQTQAARFVGFHYDLVAKQAREPELRGGQPAARGGWAIQRARPSSCVGQVQQKEIRVRVGKGIRLIHTRSGRARLRQPELRRDTAPALAPSQSPAPAG